jgi:hypothetical protein
MPPSVARAVHGSSDAGPIVGLSLSSSSYQQPPCGMEGPERTHIPPGTGSTSVSTQVREGQVAMHHPKKHGERMRRHLSAGWRPHQHQGARELCEDAKSALGGLHHRISVSHG